MRAVAAAVLGEAAPKAGGCQPRAKHQHSRAALMRCAALLIRLTRPCVLSSLRMRGAHFALGLFSCAAITRIEETGRVWRHRHAHGRGAPRYVARRCSFNAGGAYEPRQAVPRTTSRRLFVHGRRLGPRPAPPAVLVGARHEGAVET